MKERRGPYDLLHVKKCLIKFQHRFIMHYYISNVSSGGYEIWLNGEVLLKGGDIVASVLS